jgi:hypothetical protein
MLKSLSREFGLKSKENSEQLCQTKLRSLDDLLESSSEEEESGDRSSQSGSKQDSESDQDNEPPIPDFKYGNNFDLNLPRELSQIFQSRGLLTSPPLTLPSSLSLLHQRIYIGSASIISFLVGTR